MIKSRLKDSHLRENFFTKFAVRAACFLVLCPITACNKNSSQSTNQNAAQPTAIMPSTVSPGAKRYHIEGKVVSVDKQAKMLNVDSENIPGFMDAMTMPYTVKPERELNELSPGDSITADLVVQDEKAWLENIAVTQHSSQGSSK